MFAWAKDDCSTYGFIFTFTWVKLSRAKNLASFHNLDKHLLVVITNIVVGVNTCCCGKEVGVEHLVSCIHSKDIRGKSRGYKNCFIFTEHSLSHKFVWNSCRRSFKVLFSSAPQWLQCATFYFSCCKQFTVFSKQVCHCAVSIVFVVGVATTCNACL